ncbi:Fungalysin/Thermolysin Extracellular metalloproteinase 5, partial [Ceratobasidium sp. 392]
MMRLPYWVLVYSPIFLSVATAQVLRKSINFGPRHPNARYVTGPQLTPNVNASSEPYDVARSFLSNYTSSGYYIRPDSYTDHHTGVTHVYVRQLVAQLEVANGDINLNIRDGQVLSYGDSSARDQLLIVLQFYQGTALSSSPARPPNIHAAYCAGLAEQDTVSARINQVPQAIPTETLDPGRLYTQNCLLPLAAVREALATSSLSDLRDPRDPRWAALYFMVAAHPDQDFVGDLVRRFDTHLARMVVAYDQRFADAVTYSGALISDVPGAVSTIEARLVYIQTPNESKGTELHLVWRMAVEMQDNWYEAYVSASEPTNIVSVIDWVSDSLPSHAGGPRNALETKPATSYSPFESQSGSYHVWKWGVSDPSSGNRSVVKAWHDAIASPHGWHTISEDKNPPGGPSSLDKHVEAQGRTVYLQFPSTWGNNVFAQENWEGRTKWVDKYRPKVGSKMQFDYDYCLESDSHGISQCSPKDYVDLSITQLFYTTNMVHDLYYRYGFDEAAGNFQQDNYGRGGEEGDAIIAHAQDGSGYNNANFAAPPDGQHGRCRMYIWDLSSPYRDGALDAGVLIHELTHGLSNRLTGGPMNSGCLAYGEDGGMDEGWSDFMAMMVQSTEAFEDYAIGSWASDNPWGLRDY